jgi:hypothetical protein
MNLNEIKTGDVFLIYGGTFLSKSIRFFMKWFAKKKHITYNWIPSHAATFCWINDTLYLAESVDNGYHLRVFTNHYDLDNDDCCVLRTKKEYNKAETKEATRYIMELQTVSQFYYYLNFIFWPIYIILNINLFKLLHDRGITYCYESTYMVLNDVRSSDWTADMSVVDIFKLYDLDKLNIVYDHRTLI